MSDVEGTPEGPKIGADEWVARSEERTGARGGRFAPLYARAERLPWWVLLVAAVGVSALAPLRLELGLRDPRRGQHRPLRAAGARAERRRRLGRPARPRLRRLLRLRRLPLRAALVVAVRPALPGPALGLDRDRLLGAARAAAGAALASAGRRLPRDRDALLRADLRRAGDERGPDHVPVERRPDRHLRRPERDHGHRSDQHPRLRVRLDPQLPLALARRLRRRGRGAAVHQPLPHRAGVACAPRGLARRRDDEHAGEPA